MRDPGGFERLKSEAQRQSNLNANILKLTSLISWTGISSSSSYSDSSELDSSSEELVSVGVGDLITLKEPSSSRKLATLLTTGLGACLVPFHLLTTDFFSLGARIFFVDTRAGADNPK
jgi:hypothetical protein